MSVGETGGRTSGTEDEDVDALPQFSKLLTPFCCGKDVSWWFSTNIPILQLWSDVEKEKALVLQMTDS